MGFTLTEFATVRPFLYDVVARENLPAFALHEDALVNGGSGGVGASAADDYLRDHSPVSNPPSALDAAEDCSSLGVSPLSSK